MLKKIKNFLKSTSGSILPATGILIVPLTMAAGVAVDYSLYVNKRNDIQVSLDAAGLATTSYVTQLTVPANITTPDAQNAYRETKAKEYAQNFVLANLGSNVSPSDYTLDVELKTNGQGQQTVCIQHNIIR